MELIELYNLVTEVKDNSLRKRVVGACIQASYDILNEAPETENHLARLAWASDVLLNYEQKAREIFPFVLSNATLQSQKESVSDNDIQFVVNSFINKVAR